MPARLAFLSLFLALPPWLGVAAAPAQEPPKATAPADETLTTDELVRMGLPSPDRPWTGEDMTQAAEVIAEVAKKGFKRLPRDRSERSGAAFARLTSPENLDRYRVRTTPLDARLPDLLNFVAKLSQINKLYLVAFATKGVRDAETVELLGAAARLMVVMLDLTDEFLPTIKPDDPNYKVRMGGLDRMRLGAGQTVLGGLMTLSVGDAYGPDERARLIDWMRETFPRIFAGLTPASRAEMSARLDKLRDEPKLKVLEPGLGKLAAEVKEAVRAEEAREALKADQLPDSTSPRAVDESARIVLHGRAVRYRFEVPAALKKVMYESPAPDQERSTPDGRLRLAAASAAGAEDLSGLGDQFLAIYRARPFRDARIESTGAVRVAGVDWREVRIAATHEGGARIRVIVRSFGDPGRTVVLRLALVDPGGPEPIYDRIATEILDSLRLTP